MAGAHNEEGKGRRGKECKAPTHLVESKNFPMLDVLLKYCT